MYKSTPSVQDALSAFDPISLDGLSGVALMNRVDKKYIGSRSSLVPLLHALSSSHLLLEIDGRRHFSYDNLYFDTLDRTMYHNHHRGKLPREKVRRRVYVDTGSVFLEVKSKSNTGRTLKQRIVGTSLSAPFSEEEAAFIRHNSSYDPNVLQPALRTSFQRISLVNRALTQRMTIDTSVAFELEGQRSIASELMIVEVKWVKNLPIGIHPLLCAHQLRTSAFSKYSIGMALQASGVKRNLFETRLRSLRALTPIDTLP